MASHRRERTKLSQLSPSPNKLLEASDHFRRTKSGIPLGYTSQLNLRMTYEVMHVHVSSQLPKILPSASTLCLRNEPPKSSWRWCNGTPGSLASERQ
jgi:hypothetical protein